jgi:hypothetical protein
MMYVLIFSSLGLTLREEQRVPRMGDRLYPFFSQRSGSVDPKRITFQNAQRIVSEISVTLVWNIYQSSPIVFLWSHLDHLHLNRSAAQDGAPRAPQLKCKKALQLNRKLALGPRSL